MDISHQFSGFSEQLLGQSINLIAFIPHGHCYLWQPGLVWLHNVSDSIIALSYYSIPGTLVYFVNKRKDLPFDWLFLLFGSFIILCGSGHLMEIWTLWHPDYWQEGILKALTALVSVGTAIALVPLVPKALALPSPAQLEVANQALGAEISERKKAEEFIRKLNTTLEERVQERTQALEHTNTELQQTLEVNVSMQDELVQTKKQAALGRMVAGMAHELNTPIGNALLAATSLHNSSHDFGEKARTGALKRSELDSFENSCLGATELIERNLTRIANLVSTFKQLASDQSSEPRVTFDLANRIQEVLATLEHLKENRTLRVYADLPPGITLDSYPGAVGQLITIFFENALAHAFASDATGEIWVSCSMVGNDRACIVFKDNGRGIASDYVEKVFDPFFATQMGLGGIGLGLTIAHHLVTGILGGTVRLESALGHGATFIAYLPLNLGQPDLTS